ncbi:MAG: PspC domain-containing protein [Chloroflexi bacterium]|nr:PspC domain-containing protein [Chloroflexota bacterium]
MTQEPKRLYRSRSDRMISGLSAGLGNYIGLDPTIVRLIFALGGIFLFPWPIVVYLVMMLIVPEEPGMVPPPGSPPVPPPPPPAAPSTPPTTTPPPPTAGSEQIES